MHFLEDNQIREWCAGYAIAPVDDRLVDSPGISLALRRTFYQAVDPEGQEETIAKLCCEKLGAWDECLLRVKGWGIWPSSENWPAYYAARGEQNEARSLDTAPGRVDEIRSGRASGTTVEEVFAQLRQEYP